MVSSRDKSPIYEQVFPDLVLIGVHHTIEYIRPRKIQKFEKTLTGLDHLIFEGREKVLLENIKSRVDSYESRAMNSFNGEKYFLDECADYASHLLEQGVSLELFGIFKALRSLESHQGRKKDLRDYLELGQLWYYGFDKVPIYRIIELFPQLLDSFSSDKSIVDLGEGVKKFSFYLNRLRDYKIYFPEIVKLRSELQGQKGVIFGANHVQPIKGLLTREINSNYPTWAEYVEGLEESPKRGIKALENFVTLNF